MYPATDLLAQLTSDRLQDRRAAAAAHRIAESTPTRRRIAQSLRRAADRIDTATSPAGVRSAPPGRGC